MKWCKKRKEKKEVATIIIIIKILVTTITMIIKTIIITNERENNNGSHGGNGRWVRVSVHEKETSLVSMYDRPNDTLSRYVSECRAWCARFSECRLKPSRTNEVWGEKTHTSVKTFHALSARVLRGMSGLRIIWNKSRGFEKLKGRSMSRVGWYCFSRGHKNVCGHINLLNLLMPICEFTGRKV